MAARGEFAELAADHAARRRSVDHPGPACQALWIPIGEQLGGSCRKYAAQSSTLNWGAVEVEVRSARSRAALALIVRAVLSRPVRVLSCGGQPKEAQLADLHSWPELDRQRRDIGQFKRDMTRKARIDETGGGVGQQAEPAE